jgi:hypothetical protein
MTAIHALQSVPDADTRWPWFVPNGFALATVRFRQRTVLSELGRLEDPEVIVKIADILCRQKYTAVEAVRRLRALRMGKPILPQASVAELAEHIYRTIADYMSTHADLTEELVTEACSDAAEDACSDIADRDEARSAQPGADSF